MIKTHRQQTSKGALKVHITIIRVVSVINFDFLY